MSEYQYYEFQAIDRPLTLKEQEALQALSSRAHITPNRASFVYNTIGRAFDLKHNQNREIERSKTYLDDGIVVDKESEIDQSTQDYSDNIESLMGVGASKDDKREYIFNFKQNTHILTYNFACFAVKFSQSPEKHRSF